MKLRNILLFSLILIISCTFKLTPTYSPDAVAMVTTASKASDNLYDGMIASGDKTFAGHEVEYASVAAKIQDILKLDSTRKKSGVILIIGNDIKKRFAKYTESHRVAGSLNNAELKTFKDYCHALWETLYNAEINFKP